MKKTIVSPGLIDPEHPEHPDDRKARLRRSYGLPDILPHGSEVEVRQPEEPSAPEPEVSHQQTEEDPEREVQQLALDTGTSWADPYWKELAGKQWRAQTDYWSALRAWLTSKQNRQQAALEREASKRQKAESISQSAVVPEVAQGHSSPSKDSAAKELAEIQAGVHGSPTSASNRKRRAELREVLRRGR